jgi:hypothetical protein
MKSSLPWNALGIGLLACLSSCNTEIRLEQEPMSAEPLSLSIASGAGPLAPTALDLAAPAEYETATFALG